MRDHRDYPQAQTGPLSSTWEMSRHLWETARRAFVEFLKIPSIVIVGFLLLAVLVYLADEARLAGEQPSSKAIWSGLFTDPEVARDFLGVIAGSIITVTSI